MQSRIRWGDDGKTWSRRDEQEWGEMYRPVQTEESCHWEQILCSQENKENHLSISWSCVWNQIDHICISKMFRRSLWDMWVRREADAVIAITSLQCDSNWSWRELTHSWLVGWDTISASCWSKRLMKPTHWHWRTDSRIFRRRTQKKQMSKTFGIRQEVLSQIYVKKYLEQKTQIQRLDLCRHHTKDSSELTWEGSSQLLLDKGSCSSRAHTSTKLSEENFRKTSMTPKRA